MDSMSLSIPTPIILLTIFTLAQSPMIYSSQTTQRALETISKGSSR